MLASLKLLTFFAILALVDVGLVQSQNAAQMCNDSSSMAFDAQELSGIWYEVGRNPAPTTSVLCAQVNLTLQSNNVLDIATTYSNTPLYPYVNETVTASVNIGDANNSYGYNFSYVLRNPFPRKTYKLLYTDYENYALVCGYQNVTNATTFFSVFLTRDRMPSGPTLNKYEAEAAQNFSWFSNASLTVIVQQESCYYSGANRLMPLISFLFFSLTLFFIDF